MPPEFTERMKKIVTRRDYALFRRWMNRSAEIDMNGQSTIAIELERERVDGVLLATARGLLFRQDGQRTPQNLTDYYAQGAGRDEHQSKGPEESGARGAVAERPVRDSISRASCATRLRGPV